MGNEQSRRKSKIFKKKDDHHHPKEIPRFKHDPSSPITDYYEILTNHMLGKGNFSEVFLGIHKETNIRVAIKVISKATTKNKPEMLKNEVEILKKMENPYIIKLYDIFDTPNSLYLVMELVTGGELFDRIVEREQYSEANAKEVMKQLLTAIEYFHSLGIVHRDLKPENLLLEKESDDTNIKVTDFGLSRFSDLLMHTACGTAGYVAPEILTCKGYDKEVDMWSAGVILYILLSGYPPFFDEHEPRLFDSIMKAEYEFHPQYWDHISKEAKDLISKLLVVNPLKRLTAKEALHHPWFSCESSKIPLMTPQMSERLKKHNSERKSKINVKT
jgi:calcium/calmodulin-dependent protein kinase I